MPEWAQVTSALALAIAPLAMAPVYAQQAADDVLSAADDAFGLSLGNEKVGLYESDQVRGFSPVTAGNLRIGGLYFDGLGKVTDRLVDSTIMRVGISAQGHTFPAPTGIVDYRLKIAGLDGMGRIIGGVLPNSAPYAEVDLQLPLAGERLGLAVGLDYKFNEYPDGSDAGFFSRAAILRWKPAEDIVLVPFWSRSDSYDWEAPPQIFVAGPYLPPRVPHRKFFGQRWTDERDYSVNYGILGRAVLDPNWRLAAGLFRSSEVDKSKFADIFREAGQDGLAQHIIIADPPQSGSSTSGELRLTRIFADGARRHVVHFSVRGRDRRSRYGGSDRIDLGPALIGEAVPIPKPDFVFGELSHDRVRQHTFGLAYKAVWRDVGQLTLGVQKTDYEKITVQPGQQSALMHDQPWLYNVGLAAQWTQRFATYVGYTRGLEETGTAPENALNRGEALPAARTSQIDMGVRYALSPKLSLIIGGFEVEKPYFNLDADNIFKGLGQVQHRGVELSLAGALTDRLSIVAGGLWMRASVTGRAVALGRTGSKPVGSTNERVRALIEYSPPLKDGLSLQLDLLHDGDRVGSRDNLLIVPSRTEIDLGVRYRFDFGRSRAQIKLKVQNMMDSFAWRVGSNGAFRYGNGRMLTGYLAIDF